MPEIKKPLDKKVKVWVLTATSESGDDYGPEVFFTKLSKKKLSEWCHDKDGDEAKEGPGYDGSYVYPLLVRVEVK